MEVFLQPTVSDNQINDLSTFVKLKDLETLSLISNRVTDISPLAKLKHLEVLLLWKNPLGNVGKIINGVKGVAKNETNCPTTAASRGVKEYCEK